MKNEYIFKDDLVIMSMTRRNGDQFNVLIDLDDYERVSSHPYKWCINANGLGKTMFMPQTLTSPELSFIDS